MDVVSAFISVDGFQIHEMANDVEFIVNTVAAVHVPGQARDVQRLAGGIALNHGDVFRRAVAFIQQAAHPQAGLKADSDFRLHVGQFFLDQLIGG